MTSLSDPDFHVDRFDELSYRDLIDLRDILQKGLASPFWSLYGQIVRGNAKGYEMAILVPRPQPALEQAFETERNRGSLAATAILLDSPAILLEEVELKITALAAQEKFDEPRTDTHLTDADTGEQPDTNASP